MKNVCQTCLFDLEYGLPVEVRDKFLDQNKVIIPNSVPNRDYFMEQANKNVFLLLFSIFKNNFKLANLDLPYFKESNPILEKLSKNYPDYRKNEPHVCSFFLKGICNRGLECPYKHDKNELNASSDQNMKDRFHGKNDPLAEKILNKYFAHKAKLENPKDLNIKTLVVQGLGDNVSHSELKEIFEKYGEIENFNINMGKSKIRTAEVTFAARLPAEEAISNLANKLTINNVNLAVKWKIPDEEIVNLVGIPYENFDNLLIPPEMTDTRTLKPKPPVIPPPEIYQDQDKQQQVLLNIIHQSQNKGVNAYPSMNPYAIVLFFNFI